MGLLEVLFAQEDRVVAFKYHWADFGSDPVIDGIADKSGDE